MTGIDTSHPRGLCLTGTMLSDVGRVRAINEDSVAFVVPAAEQTTAERDSLLLVADGMGGHAAGEVASRLAAEIVRRVFFGFEGPAAELLNTAFAAANNAIMEHGQLHPECAGLGTTCTAIAIRGDEAWLAHVGDSRAYLLRGGELTQLSQDQTLVAKMVRDGVITAEEAKHSEHGNIILQALGSTAEIVPEIWQEPLLLAPGDTIVLCSDGLHGLVSDETIADVAGRLSPAEACRTLIEHALNGGGHDNISVGVFRALAALPRAASHAHSTTRPITLPGAGTAPDNRATRQLPAYERQP